MLSYQSNDACSLRARLSARKDPAPSHYRKSKGRISRTMGVLHTALGTVAMGASRVIPQNALLLMFI